MSFRNVRHYFADAHDATGKQVAWSEARIGSDPSNDWRGDWCVPGHGAAMLECRRRVDAMIEEDK